MRQLITLLFAALVSIGVNAQTGRLPDGFTPLFNGKDLKGWHLSKTVHHGTTGNVYVEDGAIVMKQRPYGQGGLLLTDRRYRNFELYIEVKLEWGMNSGIFLRSTEGGSAYQVELIQGGPTLGNLIGELMPVSLGAQATDVGRVWRTDDWNAFRVLVEGDAPHMTLSVNGQPMWDVRQPVNDKVADETDGMIGLQLHWGANYTIDAGSFGMNAWKPGDAIRFRAIGIRELK